MFKSKKEKYKFEELTKKYLARIVISIYTEVQEKLLPKFRKT